MNKRFNIVRNGVAAALATVGASAMAALPTGVATAVADIGTDGSALATTVLLAVVAIFAIKFLKRGL